MVWKKNSFVSENLQLKKSHMVTLVKLGYAT